MNNLKITYWQDGEYWFGFLNDYPDYVTQGLSLDESIENLKDIYQNLSEDLVPGIRKTIEIEV